MLDRSVLRLYCTVACGFQLDWQALERAARSWQHAAACVDGACPSRWSFTTALLPSKQGSKGFLQWQEQATWQ